MNINLLPWNPFHHRKFEVGRTMKNHFSRFIPLSLLIALVVALIPSPVYAAAVTGVSPSNIVSGTSAVITVTGTGFDNTAKILLDGDVVPGTVFVSDTTLQVTIPADVAVGSHIIRVSMDSGVADGSAQLTVTTSSPFQRPQLVISSSRTKGSVATNSEFKLMLEVNNVSAAKAYATQVVFTSTDLAPLGTGGVVVIGDIDPGTGRTVPQNFLVTGQLSGQQIVVVDVTITYYDEKGTSYSDKFSLTLETTNGGYSGVVYPTATPTGVKSSQLVIPSYAASLDPLQPGEQFTLTMTVQNMGNAKAQRITMIVGGGSSGGNGGGTPQPGGVSGGSGEFTNFAPVGASNVQSLGDLPPGGMIQASQNLIVNVSTNPGAYPMKVTFSYLNDKNETVNDEQVITLLVYSLPNVDVSFYRPPDPFFVGQPGMLPIQVVNIGKRASVLGNLKITSESGMIENGTGLIGSLDAGGYFTLDSMFTPEQSGKQTLNFTIDYTDDFNQPRTLTRKLEVEVVEGMMEDPMLDPSIEGGGGGGFGEGGMPIMSEPETPLQKVWRFVLGLLGLDSAPPSDSGGEQIMPEGEPIVPEVKPGAGKG
jgi:hypothetical protein